MYWFSISVIVVVEVLCEYWCFQAAQSVGMARTNFYNIIRLLTSTTTTAEEGIDDESHESSFVLLIQQEI